MSRIQWEHGREDPREYAEVVVDGHTWFSLSSVEFHVWVRKPGASKVDVDSLDSDGYAFGVSVRFIYQGSNIDNNIIYSLYQTLYPTVKLDAVDSVLRRGLELTKATMLELNILGTEHLEDWRLPTRVVKPVCYANAVADGARLTAYSRYRAWRTEQDEPHHASRRSALRSGASSEVSSQLNSV